MYKINPLLLEYRLSYFREEFDAESEKDYDKKHMHDMLDHKADLLPENNKIVIDLKNLIKKTLKKMIESVLKEYSKEMVDAEII